MSTKIVSLASTKGGCGKTVLSDAIAACLNRMGKSVLLIDMNSQMDLTLEFKLTKQQIQKSSIYRAFKHDANNPQAPFPKDFKPIHIKKNLDLLTSSKKLRNVNMLMHKNATIAPYVLGHVLSKKSGIGIANKYDYIIIDTHNDTSIPVKNAFVMSDCILAPVIPSKFGVNSVKDTIGVFNYERHHLLNPINQQSFVHAELRFIGNLIRFNTKSSHLFLQAVKNNPQFIAFINELELFNKAQTNGQNIFDCAQKEAKKGYRNDEKTLHKRIMPELNKIITFIK